MSAMMNNDDEDAVFSDEDFAAAAEAEAEARSNDAEEQAYIESIDDPECREMREYQRWLRKKESTVVLGEMHHAVFFRDRFEQHITVYLDGAEPMRLDYFDPDCHPEEKVIEMLWTRINFG